ncbi:hypothetical protein TI03_05965, partial [Achromatium sp. WMS1]
RVVVLATDYDFHQAGDHSSVMPNNGDTVLDGDPPGTGEDYPTIDQVKDALVEANIYPIFAVTYGVQSSYDDLVNQLGRGDTVELSSDSSNIVSSIQTGLENYKADFIENVISTPYDDTLTGNSLDNRIEGGAGEDTLKGLGGDDTLVGGDDADTAIYRGVYSTVPGETSEYEVTRTRLDVTVKDLVDNRDDTDTLTDIETLQFANGSIDVSSLPVEDPSINFYWSARTIASIINNCYQVMAFNWMNAICYAA